MNRKLYQALASTAILAIVAAGIWAAWKYDLPQRAMNLGFVLLGWGDTASFEPAQPTHAMDEHQVFDPRGGVSLDARRQQLIGMQTVAAEMRVLDRSIHATGIVKPDERRLVDVNVKLSGWIRGLHVDYTGKFVQQGDPLFSLYSPDLAVTEQEYLSALDARKEISPSALSDGQTYADRLVNAAERRLERWDLSPGQIGQIASSRDTSGIVALRSPASGSVVEKMAVEGMHVEPGQTLYRLADLSSVWIEANVYERDLTAVRVGLRASVTVDALQGVEMPAHVAYISPSLEEATHTAKVRLELSNSGGRLKPGMYANVTLLVPPQPSLVVPENAVFDSGSRELVFVDRGEGHFEPREVNTGARANGQVQVTVGLESGERVASSAVFLIDSESQLRGALQAFQPSTTPAVQPSTPATVKSIMTFHSTPDPARLGDNTFEVTAKSPDGGPIDEAVVGVTLFMPAMPTMNMPAMRDEFALARVEPGVYRGMRRIPMGGRWQVTVSVMRAGQPLGSLETTLVAQ